MLGQKPKRATLGKCLGNAEVWGLPVPKLFCDTTNIQFDLGLGEHILHFTPPLLYVRLSELSSVVQHAYLKEQKKKMLNLM